ncbi:MAG: pirin family protein [Enhygromyxa sp.]
MHWVGDGFPVRTLFSYSDLGRELSPFLLLDYAGPTEFPPAKTPRGVGKHPHRGFETVTLVYDGEVAHRDSSGESGVIRPGDVQWMTAGAGILHDEFHSPEFTRTGGRLEMVQLWVNLPARTKLAPPRYQALSSERIPVVTLPNSAGAARVIAGELDGHRGPADTHTPMQVWDLRLRANTKASLPIPEGWSAGLLVLRGTVRVADQPPLGAAQLAVLDRTGSDVLLEAQSDAIALLISGAPIDEPIVGYGPFVMNSVRQIQEAIADFERGEFTRR